MHCILPTMRSMRVKFFIGAIVLLTVYMFFLFLFINGFIKSDKHYRLSVPMVSLMLPYVVVHLDLKGAPPKLEYLEFLLPTLKQYGVNGLLIEYEDMFPYEGNLVNISSVNCYRKSKLKSFLTKATESGFEIIPLIQTFGHLEHVLKLEQFRHLREIQMYPDSICPSKRESRDLIKNMLKQIINFHNDIKPLKYIHFGCDEVFHINKCEQCVGKNSSNIDLFTDHVQFIANYLQHMSPSTTALIWDDMLRSTNTRLFHKVLNNVEPVYWDYQAKLHVSHVNLLKYHRSFNNIWIASAFKGADGVVATIPNIRERLFNHFSWMNLILNYKFGGEDDVYTFRGIILTGWSRYSHMDPLCELFPVSLSSLLLNLKVIERFNKIGISPNDAYVITADRFFEKYISNKCIGSRKCIGNVNMDNFDSLDFNFESRLFSVLKMYENIRTAVGAKFGGDEGILSSFEYYASKKLINMNNISKQISWCNSTLNSIAHFEMTLNHTMKRFYENYVIEEYVNAKTYYVKEKLKKMLKLLMEYESMESRDSRNREGSKLDKIGIYNIILTELSTYLGYMGGF